MNTPGPWKLDREEVWIEDDQCYTAGGQCHFTVRDANDNPLSLVLYDECDPECEPNGSLIAAAPDLLAALKASVPLLVRLGDFIGNAQGRCEAIAAAVEAIENAGDTVTVGYPAETEGEPS